MLEQLKARIAAVRFDFVKWAFPVSMASLALVLISWFLLLVYPGPKWGIDFTGGTEVALRFGEKMDIAELRTALETLHIPSDAVTEIQGGKGPEFRVRIQDPEFGAKEIEADVRKRLTAKFGADWIDEITFRPEVGARFAVSYKGEKVAPSEALSALQGIDGVKVDEGRDDKQLVVKLPGLSQQVKSEIGEAMGGRQFEVLSVDAVGPKVGESLRVQGFLSLFATLGLILIYVAFRFDLAYAPGAILALIHDVSVTVGLFILIGKEFNLTLIGALLTILGYSLNDTIVIYDRIRENRVRYSRKDLRVLVNESINETLTRTIATAGTTLVSTLAFMFVGTDVIRDFVLAISLGVVFGTYSTIYVATPMILLTEEWKPWLSKFIASPQRNAEADETDGIPEQFLTESGKRQRERERLAQQAAETEGQT